MEKSLSKLAPRIRVLEWKDDVFEVLDQTKIPWSETNIRCRNYVEVIEAIKSLAIRGAPLIGISGAYACVLAAREATQKKDSTKFLIKAFEEIETARPTAVNLRWAVQRMRRYLGGPTETLADRLLQEAKTIHSEDIECNQKIAHFGSSLFSQNAQVLTCCNTGDLATGGIGTAFGIIRAGNELGLVSHVFACETRPVLQGLRLTTWELQKNHIPFTVLCDNMAASLMEKKKITHVITGADRIAANGDSANKIGTYSLAVLAKHHGIPFYIAAPFSTFDLGIPSGKQIPIEQRSSAEVTEVLGKSMAPMECYNPSFDVTPAELITAIICDRGIISNPTTERVKSTLEGRECRA